MRECCKLLLPPPLAGMGSKAIHILGDHPPPPSLPSLVMNDKVRVGGTDKERVRRWGVEKGVMTGWERCTRIAKP